MGKLHEIRLGETDSLIQHGLSWPINYDLLTLPKHRKIIFTGQTEQLRRHGLTPSNWLQRKLSHSSICNEDDIFNKSFTNSSDAIISLCQWHLHNAQSLVNSYYSILSNDGFLIGACFGPNTLRELREVWTECSVSLEPRTIPDMHDVGDLIQQAGFTDVVVDTNHHRIAYDSADLLISDLQKLGELCSHANSGLRTPRQWQQFKQKLNKRLLDSPYLSIEIVYFHGWKTAQSPTQKQQADGSVSIPFSIKKRNS